MKPASLILFLVLCAVFFGGSAWGGSDCQPSAGDADFSFRYARLDFEGRKWFNKVDFRFEYKETLVEGSREPAADFPTGPKGQELLRIQMITDLNPLVGPKVQLSDTTWMSKSSLAAVRQLRTRTGKDETHKVYGFTEEGVNRLRREPQGRGQASNTPISWTDTKETFYPFPPEISSCGPISTPAALLPLASYLVGGGAEKPEWICIFDRKTVYRVLVDKEILSPSQGNTLDVKVEGRGTVRLGASGAVRFRFDPQPLDGDAKDGKDFSFGGLGGEVYVLVDPETALPFRISGEVSGLGAVEINLQKADPGNDEPEPAFDAKGK